jgi:HSP20 family protein
MKALQKEQHLHNEHDQHQNFVLAPVNILETKDGYILQAEMPGVSKEGLQVTLEGNEITIVGRRSDEGVNGETLFRESSRADFQRVFQLDPAIDTARITAKIEQGLLTLTLPKSEKAKPRKIEVGE